MMLAPYPGNAILAAVLASPWWTIPLAILLVAIGAWYWRRLGRGSVPRVRRRIRRASLAVVAFGLVMIVIGASLLDPATRSYAYLLSWSAVLVAVVMMVLLAALDALVTVRLHQRSVDRRLLRDAFRLRGAIADRDPEDSSRSSDVEPRS